MIIALHAYKCAYITRSIKKTYLQPITNGEYYYRRDRCLESNTYTESYAVYSEIV